MKRLAKIARRTGLAAVMAAIALVFVMPVFATGGSLSFTTESEGKTNVPIENVGIKLIFNGDVTNSSVWDSNKNGFSLEGSIVDPDDETKITKVTVPVTAYPGQKAGEENYILVIAEPVPLKENNPGQLEQKTEYVLNVSADIRSADGRTLAESHAVKFTTLDMAANSKLSMLIMVLMMVAVIGLMIVTNWRKMKAEAEAAALMKANPYRIAKERKISVDEAKELIEQAKERNRKQLEKVGGKAPTPEQPKSSVPRIESKASQKPPTHRVKGPKSAFEGGSKYAAQKKAEAEAKRKAIAAKKAAQARQQNKNSGNKSNKSNKNKKK